MSLKTEAYFRELAAENLTRAHVSEPPVSLDALANGLGIPVRPVNLPSFFGGAIVSEDGLPVMLVNYARSETERRIAMAHMLAHVMLMLDGHTDGYPRDGSAHQDADSLAKELLLPAGMLAAQARLWFNDHRYLARLFGVDEADMVARMKELQLIKGPSGVVWDY